MRFTLSLAPSALLSYTEFPSPSDHGTRGALPVAVGRWFIASDGVTDDAIRVRDWRRGVLAGQGHRRREPGRHPRSPGAAGPDGQAGPLHQRGSGHDEPVPAWRGLRHRGRHGNGPRPRPLRALRAHDHGPRQQFHDRPHLRARDRAGAARRLPRRDGAGDPAHYGRDPPQHRAGRRRRRRLHGRDRRHGRRHRVAAVPRGDPPDGRSSWGAPAACTFT